MGRCRYHDTLPPRALLDACPTTEPIQVCPGTGLVLLGPEYRCQAVAAVGPPLTAR